MIEIIVKEKGSGKSKYILNEAKKYESSIVLCTHFNDVKNYQRNDIQAYYYKGTTIELSKYQNIFYDECFYMYNLPIPFLHNLTVEYGTRVIMIGTPETKITKEHNSNMYNYCREYYPEYLI